MSASSLYYLELQPKDGSLQHLPPGIQPKDDIHQLLLPGTPAQGWQSPLSSLYCPRMALSSLYYLELQAKDGSLQPALMPDDRIVAQVVWRNLHYRIDPDFQKSLRGQN